MVLESGGMVAGFGLLLKTNITNASNTIVIASWYHKVVAWWQVLGHCLKQASQMQVIVY